MQQYQLNIIKVFPVTAPFSSDRLVQMVGKFEKVFECFRVIYDTLEVGFCDAESERSTNVGDLWRLQGQVIKGLVENYNSANFDENLTMGYGGWSNQTGFDSMRKPGPALLGGPSGGGGGGGGGGPGVGGGGDVGEGCGRWLTDRADPFLDRSPAPNGRFSNNNTNNNSGIGGGIGNLGSNRPNEQFFSKPDNMGRMNNNNNSNAPKPMSRFDAFASDSPTGFDM